LHRPEPKLQRRPPKLFRLAANLPRRAPKFGRHRHRKDVIPLLRGESVGCCLDGAVPVAMKLSTAF
jgi:hypothetical protein